MGSLETNDDVGVLLGDARGFLGLHVAGIVLSRGAHAIGHNVHKCQDTSVRPVNHALAEIREISPPLRNRHRPR